MKDDKRLFVKSIISKMTLVEKIGQMVQADLSWNVDVEEFIKTGRIGSVLSVRDPHEINEIQRISVEESRLGIPLLVGNDVIHGYKTIFPIPLAQAASWDLELIEKSERIASKEAISYGTNWNFTPMVNVARDPRWGRVAEGAGEDPFLGSEIAKARVKGIQAKGLLDKKWVAACVKHFAGYGAAEGGRDYNTVDLSEQRLRDVYLPPFKAALDAGCKTIMTAFNELNGVPATADPFLLKEILRGEWKFDGVVLSDFDAIGELIQHGFSPNHREAALQAVNSTVDIDMMGNAYPFHLEELVNDGEVEMVVVDKAVERILDLKYELGLFENPYIDESLHETICLSEEHKLAALELAEHACVLLKNEDRVLPLQKKNMTLAVIGPLADDKESILGSWCCEGEPADAVSVLEGIQEKFPEFNIKYSKGCAIDGEKTDFSEAVLAAEQSDIVLLVLGESAEMSGEAHCRAFLGLPGAQLEFAKAIKATGKPIVVVLSCGRPLVISWLIEHADAILMGWQGGTMFGRAVANILAGDFNPCGKLPVSFPRAEGQIPIYYSHKSTGRPVAARAVIQFNKEHKSKYLDIGSLPAFQFGFGLSYAAFEYSNLLISAAEYSVGDTLIVNVDVKNTSSCDGYEIVQLYIQDLFGSVTRPVKELKGFKKIHLKAFEKRTVQFAVPCSSFGFCDQNMAYKVEPGEFKLWVGPNSYEGLPGKFTIIN